MRPSMPCSLSFLRFSWSLLSSPQLNTTRPFDWASPMKAMFCSSSSVWPLIPWRRAENKFGPEYNKQVVPIQLGKSSAEEGTFRFCCVSCPEPSFVLAKKKKRCPEEKWNWLKLTCLFPCGVSVRLFSHYVEPEPSLKCWHVTDLLYLVIDKEHTAYTLPCPCTEKPVLFGGDTDKRLTSCSPEYPHSGRNWWRFEWSGSGCPSAQDTCLRFPEWGRGWGICSACGAPWGETQDTMSAASNQPFLQPNSCTAM